MKEFILIFRHDNPAGKVSPEQMEIWMKQTMDWVGSIAAQNKFVSGTGLLFDDAKVVKHKGVITNGPFGDIKETLGGFVIVKAKDSAEAAEMAKNSPILQGEENTIEVREIVKHTN